MVYQMKKISCYQEYHEGISSMVYNGHLLVFINDNTDYYIYELDEEPEHLFCIRKIPDLVEKLAKYDLNISTDITGYNYSEYRITKPLFGNNDD